MYIFFHYIWSCCNLQLSTRSWMSRTKFKTSIIKNKIPQRKKKKKILKKKKKVWSTKKEQKTLNKCSSIKKIYCFLLTINHKFKESQTTSVLVYWSCCRHVRKFDLFLVRLIKYCRENCEFIVIFIHGTS